MSLVKEYTYKEISYTVSVYLHYTNERALNGKSFHKITVDIKQFDYSKSVMADSSNDIKDSIAKAEEHAQTVINEHLEGPSKTQQTNQLLELGFTETKFSRKPIAPEQMPTEFPDYVIEAFDIMIADKFNISKKEATVYQKEVVAKILQIAKSKKIKGITSQYLFDNNLLDIEKTYRKAGWDVTYHKPDYTESSFPEFFIFKQK